MEHVNVFRSYCILRSYYLSYWVTSSQPQCLKLYGKSIQMCSLRSISAPQAIVCVYVCLKVCLLTFWSVAGDSFRFKQMRVYKSGWIILMDRFNTLSWFKQPMKNSSHTQIMFAFLERTSSQENNWNAQPHTQTFVHICASMSFLFYFIYLLIFFCMLWGGENAKAAGLDITIVWSPMNPHSKKCWVKTTQRLG